MRVRGGTRPKGTLSVRVYLCLSVSVFRSEAWVPLPDCPFSDLGLSHCLSFSLLSTMRSVPLTPQVSLCQPLGCEQILILWAVPWRGPLSVPVSPWGSKKERRAAGGRPCWPWWVTRVWCLSRSPRGLRCSLCCSRRSLGIGRFELHLRCQRGAQWAQCLLGARNSP